MVKGFKGLKRLGAFVLSLVMAASIAVTVAPEIKAQATTYAPLQPSTDKQVVVKDWDFETGLKTLGIWGTIVKWDEHYAANAALTVGERAEGKTVVFGEEGLIIKFKEGYTSYDGKKFDIYIRLKSGPSLTPDTSLTFRSGTNGGVYIGNGSNPMISLSTGFTNSTTGTDYEYELWLRHNEDGTDTATTWDKPMTEIDKNEPFVCGNCYMAGETAPGSNSIEAARPWSSNGILYANDNLYDGNHYWNYKEYQFGGQKYTGWINAIEAASDEADRFVIGYGYTDNHTVKNGYTNKVKDSTNSGVGEIVLGYRVRKLIFKVFDSDTGYVDPTLTKDGTSYLEGSEVSRGVKPYNGGTKYTPKEFFEDDSSAFNPGASFAFWTVGQDVHLSNGKTIYKGQIITEEDMPYVIIEGNPEKPDLIFYAHTTATPYTPPASPIDPAPTPAPIPNEPDTDTPSTGEPIKVEFVTPIGNPPPTQIKHVGDKADDPGAPIDPATLKPGTIIDGHRFEGWYLDKGFTMPYNFDTKLPHSIVLYAKWVRVSPKTGDTTIPAVYYVFGALAFAGVRALAAKSRKLRK